MLKREPSFCVLVLHHTARGKLVLCLSQLLLLTQNLCYENHFQSFQWGDWNSQQLIPCKNHCWSRLVRNSLHPGSLEIVQIECIPCCLSSRFCALDTVRPIWVYDGRLTRGTADLLHVFQTCAYRIFSISNWPGSCFLILMQSQVWWH